MLAATSARCSGVGADTSRSAFRQAISRQVGMSWNTPASSAVPGRLRVVDRRIEATGDLGVQVVGDAVEENVHAVVIGLAAGAVGLHEPDAGERERQVALDVGVDAQREVALRVHRAVGGGLERDRPRRGDVVAPTRVPGVEGVEVQAGEDGVLVVDEPGVLEERRILDRAPVLLGRPQVGEGEDAVVVARPRQRVEAPTHLADDGVDATRPAGGAVVLARRVVLGRQTGQQVPSSR